MRMATGAPLVRFRHQRSPVVRYTSVPSRTYETGVEYRRPVFRPVHEKTANQRLSGQWTGDQRSARMAGFHRRNNAPSSEPRSAGLLTRLKVVPQGLP